MGKKNKDIYHEEVKQEIAEEAVEETPVDEVPEVAPTIYGKVICEGHLNIRSTPIVLKDNVVAIIPKGYKVLIESDDDKEFYKVVLPEGIEGYAMKKHILTYVDPEDTYN